MSAAMSCRPQGTTLFLINGRQTWAVMCWSPCSGDVGDQQSDEPLALPHCGGRVLPERDHVERAVKALQSAFELSGPGSLGQEEPFKAQETR
jgi:hypothetical protein